MFLAYYKTIVVVKVGSRTNITRGIRRPSLRRHDWRILGQDQQGPEGAVSEGRGESEAHQAGREQWAGYWGQQGFLLHYPGAD